VSGAAHAPVCAGSAVDREEDRDQDHDQPDPGRAASTRLPSDALAGDPMPSLVVRPTPIGIRAEQTPSHAPAPRSVHWFVANAAGKKA
jgi:hypothetical protein